jgi:DNA-binding MarR family transcriptional regulator
MGYLTVKQASRKLGVTPHTIRAWIRELKEKEPITHSTHILTHSHKFNKRHITYTLTEELVNEWGNKLRTHSTHSNTHFSTHSVTYPEGEERMGFTEPPGREKTQQGNSGQDISGQAVLSGVIETLRGEIERQGDTIKQILQDHAKERERTDIIIMQLRADIMKLLPEGKQEQGKPPEDKDQEKAKQDTPEKPEQEYKFTFGDRLWLFKEDVKRVLNKKIF